MVCRQSFPYRIMEGLPVTRTRTEKTSIGAGALNANDGGRWLLLVAFVAHPDSSSKQAKAQPLLQELANFLRENNFRSSSEVVGRFRRNVPLP